MNKKITIAIATALTLASVSSFAVEKIYCSGEDDNDVIPDDDSFSITIPATDTGNLTDLNVGLIFTHEWPGDLEVTIGHAGTQTFLIDKIAKAGGSVGSCSADITQNGDEFLLLDDEGTTSIQTQCPPKLDNSQSFKPKDPLTAFDGKSVNGDWTITFTDTSGGEAGSFIMACLQANIEEGSDPISGDFNNDGKVDVFDLATFKEWFLSKDARADLNNSGGAPDLADLAVFRQYWTAVNP